MLEKERQSGMKKIIALLLVFFVFLLSACGADAKQVSTPENASNSESTPEQNMVSIEFPAYQEGKTEYNAQIYETQPFQLQMTLPDGWEVRKPEETVQQDENMLLFTPMELYKDGVYAGYVGFHIYEETESVPEEQYYQMVYSQIRLGSVCFWDMEPYSPLNKTETGETALAVVNYKELEQMKDPNKSAAQIPYVEIPAIVSYNKEKKMYIGVQFAQGMIDDEQIEEIADSIVLS